MAFQFIEGAIRGSGHEIGKGIAQVGMKALNFESKSQTASSDDVPQTFENQTHLRMVKSKRQFKHKSNRFRVRHGFRQSRYRKRF